MVRSIEEIEQLIPQKRGSTGSFKSIAYVLLTLIGLGLIVEVHNFSNRYSTNSYSEKVRKNINNLLGRGADIFYQKEDGPIRPFLTFFAKYPVAENYPVTACYVPKVMTTTLHGFFCYLRNSETFDQLNMNLKKIYWNNPNCGGPKTMVNSTSKLLDVLPKNHYTFEVVRDPVHRFVSAFVNKCIDEREYYEKTNRTRLFCYGCEHDLHCVAKTVYRELLNLARKDEVYDYDPGQKTQFYYTEHFLPLTWHCNIRDRYNMIDFVRYAPGGPRKKTMSKNILDVMRKAKVERYKIRKMEEVLLDDQPLTHATKGMDQVTQYTEQVYNNEETLTLLKKMYYYDFIVFDYAVPVLGKVTEE